MTGLIHPVILSGGAGTRLWPLSRQQAPKQFEALTGDHSMIQETALRFADSANFAAPMVVCNHAHRQMAQQHLEAIDMPPSQIVMEPIGRNTAPAIAAAALALQSAHGDDALMLIAPADHFIARPAALVDAVKQAAPAAAQGYLVTFGVVPTAPKTGYGYIEAVSELDGLSPVQAIKAFVEKPDLETAKSYLAGGQHSWNSGIFLFRVGSLIDALKTLNAALLNAVQAAVARGAQDANTLLLDEASFAQAEAISIDYAVMEKTNKGAIVPLVDSGWSDVGAWSELWEQSDKDTANNAAVQGELVSVNASGNLVRAGKLVALVGVEDLVVIDTQDALLVAKRDQAQDVKQIAEALAKQGRSEAIKHKG